MRSLGPQSLHNGEVLSYLVKAVMVTRLVPIHSPMYHTIKEDKFLPMSYPLGNYTNSPGQHIGMIYCTCQVVRVSHTRYPDLTSESHIKEDKLLPMSYPLGNYSNSPGQHFGMIYCTCQAVRVESHKLTRYPDHSPMHHTIKEDKHVNLCDNLKRRLTASTELHTCPGLT